MMPPLPTNLEAERAILGTVLRDNAQLAKVREILRPEDFSSIENAFLFRTMLRFADTGNPIDLITLTDFLEAQKEIGKVGGKAYIASLCDGLYRISNVEKYARIVKDKSVKRSVIHATELVQLHAFDGKTPEDVLRTLKAQVEAIERSLPQSPTAATNNIKIWTLQQFLVEEFPPREPLVVIKNSETPVFTARSVNQIFAFRGSGKSMIGMAIANMLSTAGEFLHWKALRPVSVLYVDGELPDAMLQERARLIAPNADFQLISLDSNKGNIPNLATKEGQAWLEPYLADVEFLILDSIASLAPFATNDEEEWLPFSLWLMRLRSRGTGILCMHQAGKLGSQRGHSRGDDPLDVQIKLTRREEDEDADHLKCLLTYEKFRGPRKGVFSLEIEYDQDWKWAPLEANKMQALEEYLCMHPTASSRTVAEALPELGSHSTVLRLLRKMKREREANT